MSTKAHVSSSTTVTALITASVAGLVVASVFTPVVIDWIVGGLSREATVGITTPRVKLT